MKKRIHYLWVIVIYIAISCTGAQQTESSQNDPLTLFADSVFNANVDSARIAGAAVLVAKGDEILLKSSYGYADLEFDVPMPLDASFEIGSITKQFTAAAILKLVEQDKLKLDDDITTHLDFNTGGRVVKVGQLLNHTSGIASYTELSEFWPLSLHSYERDTLLRVVENAGFLFEPGEAQIYNNSAYFMLGLIIEELSGMSYEEYLEQEIFGPLGMNNTYYCSNSAVIKKKAYGYNYSPEGLQQKPYLDHTWPYAAGSLCSTVEDLYTWLKALHHGEVFGPDTYSLMITPEALSDGSPLRYAMGLNHYENYGNETISHGGGINGFLSDSRYFPEEDLYMICLVNTTGPAGAGFFTNLLTWELFERSDYPSLDVTEPTDDIPGMYVGQVRGRVLNLKVDLLDGALLINSNPQEPADTDTLDIYAGERTWMDGNDRLTFEEGQLKIDQVGAYYILKKNSEQ